MTAIECAWWGRLLEFTGLAQQAAVESFGSLALTAERARQAIELARRHGWTDEPPAGIADLMLGAVLMWQGQPEEAEPWLQRAERNVRDEAEPAAGLGIRSIRGMLELARGRDADALAAFQAAERLARCLAEPSLIVMTNRSFLVQTLMRQRAHRPVLTRSARDGIRHLLRRCASMAGILIGLLFV